MKKAVQYVGLALAVLATACVTPIHTAAQRRGIEGSFDRTLNVSGTVDLDVSTGSGGISIRKGSAGRVEVHGRIRVGTDWFRSDRNAEDVVRDLESNPPIEQTGSTIRIGRFQGRDTTRNVSISYEIVIPAQASVRSNTGSGSQTVIGIEGPVVASTGSGGITLTDIRGRARATTGSGAIHAEGIAGPFEGSTGSGGVNFTQTATGDVEIGTGSGTVRASGVRGALRIHTGSGGITAQGEQTGRWDLQTSSGSISIRLPRDAGFDLNAHTSSGGVYLDHPLTVQGKIDRRRRDVSGRVRGGGHALDVRTSSGSIRIE